MTKQLIGRFLALGVLLTLIASVPLASANNPRRQQLQDTIAKAEKKIKKIEKKIDKNKTKATLLRIEHGWSSPLVTEAYDKERKLYGKREKIRREILDPAKKELAETSPVNESP